MSVTVYGQMNTSHMPGIHPVAIPRPQVGIERLPPRRMSNEPRESMNCKSCRKRKIKCNRLRPSCEACQVFQCPCIYDAVPKKRGPKTDVLEALLKRVDGLEAKLREKNDEEISPTVSTSKEKEATRTEAQNADGGEPAAKRIALDTQVSPASVDTATFSPHTPVIREWDPTLVQMDVALDTFFARFHGKPYYILDESSVRQRLQVNQLPSYLCHAISAVAARYLPNPKGYEAAIKLSNEYAARSRREINTEEPSIDALQALLLLVSTYTASGEGKKAHMLMTIAVGMAVALEIHREMDNHARATPVERETRRRLFWTCYLLDRFQATGSKRPSLISDDSIFLRLPSWSPNPSSLPIEGEFFQRASKPVHSNNGSLGNTGILIDIARILGEANKYLASGGAKGDSHFPWHSMSTLSRIRNELDVWASGTEDVFANLRSVFGQTDSTILILSKLIFHLVHCLIYRPFLPVDLSELAANGQHQSWQLDAMNICFVNANAIAEIIELGKANTLEWPSFVGYCISTAATVHIHGAHYTKQDSESVFSASSDFLPRVMQHLKDLQRTWASIQNQLETLQDISKTHSELVKAIANKSIRYTPNIHNEAFFERYASFGGQGGQPSGFDIAHLKLLDMSVSPAPESLPRQDMFGASAPIEFNRPSLKRKNTAPVSRKRPDIKAISSLHTPLTPGLPTPGYARRSYSYTAGMVSQSSPGYLTTPTSLAPHMEGHEHDHNLSSLHGHVNETTANHAAVAAAAAAGFGLSPSTSHPPSHGMLGICGPPYSPPYSYGSGSSANNGVPMINDMNGGYDAMFGTLPPNSFGSPATWPGEENPHHAQLSQAQSTATAPSPSARSNNGSIGTVHGDEKDPFMTLLEQLAESEQRSQNTGQGTELDFFLSGGNTSN